MGIRNPLKPDLVLLAPPKDNALLSAIGVALASLLKKNVAISQWKWRKNSRFDFAWELRDYYCAIYICLFFWEWNAKWNGMKKASVCVFSRDQGVIRCGVIWFQSGVDPALIGCIFKINEWNVATCTEFVSQPEIEFYRMGLVMVWQCLGLPNLNCCAEFDSTLNLCIFKFFFFFLGWMHFEEAVVLKSVV